MLEEQAALIKKQIDRIKSGAANYKEPTVEAPAAPNAGAEKKVKKVIDPNRPKRPASGYLLFMAEENPSFKAANPTLTQPELMSAVAKKWNVLSPDVKQKFMNQAEKLKTEYNDKVKIYDTKNPPVVPVAAPKKNKPAAAKPAEAAKAPVVAVKAPVVVAPVEVAKEEVPVEEKKEKKKDKKRKDEGEDAEAPSTDKKKKKHKKDKSESEA